MTNTSIRAALATLRADNAWTLEQQTSICEIAAPPFKEAARAAEFRRRLQSLGIANLRTAGMVYFVGTVGEEGAGNLRGVRALFSGELKGKIDYFISVDGTGSGSTGGAVGSNRYRVSYKGSGGHSYGAFGMPNPIHAMGRAIAKLADVAVPELPKTTFSASVVHGSTSVNSIPFECIVEVGMRSESAASLAALDAKFQLAIRDALREESARWPNNRVPLTMTLDTIGIRLGSVVSHKYAT